MKNWKSILLLVLVFLAGLAVGVVGTRIAVRRIIQQAIVHPERVQTLLERDLTRKLHLDNHQQVQLHGILTDARSQLGKLRQEYQPQAGAIFLNADQSLAALLTPDQQVRYEKFKQANRPLWRTLRNEP